MRKGNIDKHHFYLTTYYYPLDKPIALNESLNFFFDNPKTDEEIALIKQSFQSTLFTNKPKILLGPTLKSHNKDWSIQSGIEKVSIGNIDYKKIDKELLEQDPLEYLVRIAIIIRYENPKIIEAQKEIDKQKEQGNENIFLNNKASENSKSEVVSIVSILSLLLSKEEIKEGWYDGETFISASIEELAYDYYNYKLFSDVCRYEGDCHITDKHFICNRKITEKKLLKYITLLSNLINKSEAVKYKTLYIGELIAMENKTDDPKIKILLLSSAFECLLVKGSSEINKQYKFKLSFLINELHGTKDKKKLTVFFGELYDLRSKIAHGNYSGIKKIIKKRQEKFNIDGNTFYENDNRVLNRYVFMFYDILYNILNIYLTDTELIEKARNLKDYQ